MIKRSLSSFIRFNTMTKTNYFPALNQKYSSNQNLRPTEEDRLRIRKYYTDNFNQRVQKAQKLKQDIIQGNFGQDFITIFKILVRDGLTDIQKRYCDMLTDRLLNLTAEELQYFYLKLMNMKYKDQTLMGMNIDLLNVPKNGKDCTAQCKNLLADGTYAKVVPGYFKQQQLMSKIEPTINLAEIMGVQQTQQQEISQSKLQKTDTKQQQAKGEKQAYDIEFKSFDSSAKIKIIKQYRQIMKLGLKQAKQQVQKVPFWIKKGVKKDQAQQMAEKLRAVGAQINLV